MIQCKFHNVGCEVMMARKDQTQHDNKNVKEHLMKTKLLSPSYCIKVQLAINRMEVLQLIIIDK